MSEDDSSPDNLIGRVIAGKLELQELLGSGAMGQVYKAHHRGLNKQIAIKVMRAETMPTERQLARFRAEAQASSRLDHPNSVQILDFGEDGEDQLMYIAMEFLDGKELTSALRGRRQMDEERTCRIMVQVLAALAAAHDQGVVHRDIKPGNIMLVKKMGDDGLIDDFVKVCDFGIAKLVAKNGDADVEPLTLTGVSLGTPAYASPEQIMGEKLDGRSDIYSCGVVLYFMLAGQRPFIAESPVALAMLTISQQEDPLESVRPGINPALAAIVRRAMAKRPEDRFPTAREMRAALKPLAGSPPTGEHTPWATVPPHQSLKSADSAETPPPLPGSNEAQDAATILPPEVQSVAAAAMAQTAEKPVQEAAVADSAADPSSFGLGRDISNSVELPGEDDGAPKPQRSKRMGILVMVMAFLVAAMTFLGFSELFRK